LEIDENNHILFLNNGEKTPKKKKKKSIQNIRSQSLTRCKDTNEKANTIEIFKKKSMYLQQNKLLFVVSKGF
jgi:hypothetical protein